MKKRYYISFIITIILLLFTNKIWLISNIFYGYPFIIILICGYLLSLKLTSYLADFKNIQNQSRIEIVFLTVFFVMLFIPMSHITQDNISLNENRTLAQWKPFLQKNGKLNYNFGKDFDNWFNDRFCMRKILISFYNNVLNKYSKHNKKYYIDPKTGFMYGKHETKLLNDGINPTEYFKELYKFNNFLKKHNIKLYVLIVPPRGLIYPTPEYKTSDKEFQSTVDKINEEGKIKLIYPAKAMKAASTNDYIFFKTEHHWTDPGAFVGYKELIKVIKQDYPNIKEVYPEDFDYFYSKKIRGDFNRKFGEGQTCKNYDIPKKICKKSSNVEYKYFKHKEINKLNVKIYNKPKFKGKYYYYPNGSNLRVILLGTSMSENLTESLPFSFKYLFRLRNNSVKDMPTKEEFKIIKYYKQKIIDYKPDILILCITTWNVPKLNQLFEE